MKIRSPLPFFAVLACLALCSCGQDSGDKAVKTSAELLEGLPLLRESADKPESTLVKQALAEYDQKRYGAALAKLQEAAKLKPNDELITGLMVRIKQTLVDRAVADFDKKKYDDAVAKLTEVDKILPDDEFILNLIGAAYTKKKDFDTAKKYFQKALDLKPDFFPARFNQGEILFLQKQYPQALSFFTEMLRMAPANELLQFKVVLSLLMTDQLDDARRLAARMRYPGDSPAWYYAQAAVERKAGNNAKASEYIRSANALFPKDISLYNETFEDLGWPTK